MLVGCARCGFALPCPCQERRAPQWRCREWMRFFPGPYPRLIPPCDWIQPFSERMGEIAKTHFLEARTDSRPGHEDYRWHLLPSSGRALCPHLERLEWEVQGVFMFWYFFLVFLSLHSKRVALHADLKYFSLDILPGSALRVFIKNLRHLVTFVGGCPSSHHPTSKPTPLDYHPGTHLACSNRHFLVPPGDLP